MLVKLFIFLGGTLIESITKDYLKGKCGKNFKGRTKFLSDSGIIDAKLKSDIDWVWDTRNNMHLFQLNDWEYENTYNGKSHARSTSAYKELINAIHDHES